MELLTEIRNAIDFLKAKPEEIDVTEMVRILSLCHEVGRDGLQRSQNAGLYLQLKPKLEQLETRVPELEAELVKQTDLLAKACVEIDTFNEVLAEMRRDTLGKLELTKSVEPGVRTAREKKINEGDIAGVLEVRSQVLSDFNKEWGQSAGAEKLSTATTGFVDHKLYQTGE